MKKTHFPPLKKTLIQLIGPSIIFVAISLNGGELLLWPNLAANFSLKMLWAIPIILTLQFFVNIEIERYTLVTGKSTELGLVKKSVWLPFVLGFSVLISLVWPAWITTAGNILAELFISDQSEEIKRNTGLIASIILLILAIFVFKSKKSYKTIETISKYGLIIALTIITGTVITNFDLAIFLEGITGLFSWGYIPEEMPRFDFLAALAYGGVSGVLNLAQSEWVQSKKYGASELSKKQRKNIDYNSKESQKNFKKWFNIINKEHFLLFFCANIFSIFLLAYLGRILVPEGTAEGFNVLATEIATLNQKLPFAGTLFGISGFIIFFMANIAILDAIGRLMHQILKPIQKITKRNLSSENISIASIIIGIAILVLSLVFPNFKQPFILLVISASLSAMIMWLYPPLLIKLNLELPKKTRPKIWRIIMLVLCTVFYGVVSIWALSSLLPAWIIAPIAIIITLYQLYTLFKKQS